MLAIAALAWAYLFYLDWQMTGMLASASMPGMDMPQAVRRTAGEFLLMFAMWVVMMIGMMLGSAVPVILLFAATQNRRSNSRVPLAALLFGIGYLTVWAGFSVFAVIAQWALHDAALLSPGMALTSSYVSAAVLAAAGLYQLTPLKHACLRHCQSPLGFLMSRWRDGKLGALQMGMRHGVYCLGCCWAIMSVLFVVGVMNLVWVAVLAILVLLEKTSVAGRALSYAAGMAMIAAAVLILAGFL